MASFIVLAPQAENGQRDDDKTVFIQDGFAFVAFLLSVPWLLVQRLWFEAALVLAGMIALSIAGNYTGHDGMAGFVTALLTLFVGLEGNNWKIAALKRQGSEELGVVDADNAADAETGWFLGGDFARLPIHPAAKVKLDASAAPALRKPALGGMVGLVTLRGEN